MIQIHQQQRRADAYYQNMVALIFGERCRMKAATEKYGPLSSEAADARFRLYTLLITVESVERGEFDEVCETCGEPLKEGQQVVHYSEDCVTVHGDCSNPARAVEHSRPFEEFYTPQLCAEEVAKARAVYNEVMADE